MADTAKDEVVEQHYLLTSTDASSLPSSSSRSHRSSFDDSDANDYFVHRPRRSLVARALRSLGFSPRRMSHDEFPGPSRKHKTPSPWKPTRRSTISTILKRLLLILPLLILVTFGVLHILQVVLGRARVFWDTDAEHVFLPQWGQPSHPGAGLVEFPTDATRDILPVRCHSHNDYSRRVPLFDAIHAGCTGVEADVWLFDEELYVGHTIGALTRNRTFTAMYVDPLVRLLDQMNLATDFSNDTRHGVFDVDPAQSLVLLVDFKTNGHDLFPVVSRQLQALREKDYLSYWNGTHVNSRAITVVGTGNTPYDMVVASHERRDIFFDAPLGRLWAPATPPGHDPVSDHEQNPSPHPPRSEQKWPLDLASPTSSSQGQVGTELLTSPDAFNPSTSYYASTSLRAAVGFLWRGHLSPRQMDIIRGQIRGAHSRGLKVRYWDTPGWPISVRNHVWHVLMKEGADMLNADDVRAAAHEDWTIRRHEWW